MPDAVRATIAELRAVSEALTDVDGESLAGGRPPGYWLGRCRTLADDLAADPSNPVHRIASRYVLRCARHLLDEEDDGV